MPAPTGPREQRARQLVHDAMLGRVDYGKLDKPDQIEVYNWLVYNVQSPETRQEMDLPDPASWEKQLGRVERRDARTARTAAATAATEGGGLGKAFGRGLAESATFGLHKKYLPGLAAQLEGKPEGLAETIAEYAGHAAGFIPSMTVGAKVGVPLRAVQALRWLAGLKKAGTAARALHPVAERAIGEASLGAFVGAGRELAQAGVAGERPLTPGGVLKSAATDAAYFAPFGALRGRGQIGGTARQIIKGVGAGQAVNVGGREILPNLAQFAREGAAPGFERMEPAVAAKVLEILEGATKSVPRTGRPSGYFPFLKTRLPQELQQGKLGALIRASRESPEQAIREAIEGTAGAVPAATASPEAAVQAAVQGILRDWPTAITPKGPIPREIQMDLPLSRSVPVEGALGITRERPISDLNALLEAITKAAIPAPSPAVAGAKPKGRPRKPAVSAPPAAPVIKPAAPPVTGAKTIPPTVVVQAVEAVSKQTGVSKEKVVQAARAEFGENWAEKLIASRPSAVAPKTKGRARAQQPETTVAKSEIATGTAGEPQVVSRELLEKARATMIPTAPAPLKPAGAETPGVPARREKPAVIGTVRMKPGPGHEKGMEYPVIKENPTTFTVLYTGWDQKAKKRVFNSPRSINKSGVLEYVPKAAKGLTPEGLATQPGSIAPAEFRVPKGTFKLTKPEIDQRQAILTAYPEKTSVNPAGNRVTIFTEESASDLKQKFPLFDWEKVEGGVAGTLLRQYTKAPEKVRRGVSRKIAQASSGEERVGPKSELRAQSAAPHQGKQWLAGDLVKVLRSTVTGAQPSKQTLADEYSILGFFWPPRGVRKALQARHGSESEYVKVKNTRTGQEMGVPVYQLQHLGAGATPRGTPAKPGTPDITSGSVNL